MRKKRFRIASLAMLLFFGNEFIANEVMMAWETDPTPISEVEDQKFDYAIILTGVVNSGKEPFDRVFFNKGADRVLHPVQLYKKGIVKKILITGGSGRLVTKLRSEAPLLKQVLLDCGVKEKHIVVEPESRNTYENAKFTAEYLKKNDPKASKFLLITSAFHMRRSYSCFVNQGLDVVPYACDYFSHERRWAPDEWIIPYVSAYGKWSVLMKEWVGSIMYWMTGKI